MEDVLNVLSMFQADLCGNAADRAKLQFLAALARHVFDIAPAEPLHLAKSEFKPAYRQLGGRSEHRLRFWVNL